MTETVVRFGEDGVPVWMGFMKLRCPVCHAEGECPRVASDYPEAVVMEIPCDACHGPDRAEAMYFDADGNHITRDPKLPLTVSEKP